MNAVAECSDDGINVLQCVTDILGMNLIPTLYNAISYPGGRTKKFN